MILMDIPKTEAVDSWFRRYVEEDGLTIVTLAAGKLDLEYKKGGPLYLVSLWIMAFYSFVTNLSQAIYVKIFKKMGFSLRRVLWEMGRDEKHFSCFFGDRFSRFNHLAKTGAASWRALDLFYNYHEKIEPNLNSDLEGVLTRYWMGRLCNRQAVANRLKVVVILLTKAFQGFVNSPEVRILSVASGSAQSVIEAIKKCPRINVKALLLDRDQTAIEQSRKLVQEAGLEGNFSFVCDRVTVLEKICAGFQPHIIEMVGFLDYRPQKQAIRMVSRIRNCLPEGGILLTCNIRKNIEKPLLDWVLLWPMYYRGEKVFSELLVKGGFYPQNIEIIYEPHKIHGIGVCKK